MFKFFGYAIQGHPQLFPTRVAIEEFCRGNGVDFSLIVQLFHNAKVEYVEPKEVVQVGQSENP